MNYLALCSAVFERYTTQAALCDALRWKKRKVTRLLTGKYQPDTDEAAALSYLLCLTYDEYIQIFLS